VANDLDASGNLLQTAVLWEHEQPVNLGALHPGWNSYALDVSTSGVVVGASGSIGAEFPTPVVWYGGTVHALPLLPDEAGGWAEEINARGVIVGWQASATNEIRCLWYWNGSGYTAVNLGSLGGNYGQAFGMNNLNKAVGYSLYAGNIHGPAFLWDHRHGLQALPLLRPDTDGIAYNINDLGQIVGERGSVWRNERLKGNHRAMLPNRCPLGDQNFRCHHIPGYPHPSPPICVWAQAGPADSNSTTSKFTESDDRIKQMVPAAASSTPKRPRSRDTRGSSARSPRTQEIGLAYRFNGFR
jgi:uncharacterized membrane protein